MQKKTSKCPLKQDEDGMRKVLAGQTSIDEVLRVTQDQAELDLD